MSSETPAILFQEIRRGRQYVEYADGTHLTRRVDRSTFAPLGPWSAVEPVLPPADSSSSPPPPLSLSVVVEHQAPGEPKHWSLFCHRGDDGRGRLLQVTGDAEHMHYAHEADADKLGGGNGDLAWHQVLNGDVTAAQRATVEEVVGTEAPPQAPSRAAVTENCQGWVVRVLTRLAAEGIVEEDKVDKLREQMDPV